MMNGQHGVADHPRILPRTGGDPPGYDRVMAALRRSARLLFTVGTLAAASGAGLVAVALLDPAGGLARPVLLGAGGFFLVLALLPLGIAWRRVRRASFLAALRVRWSRLARIGDPDDQVATLARAYAGLIGRDMRARMRGAR